MMVLERILGMIQLTKKVRNLYLGPQGKFLNMIQNMNVMEQADW